MNLTSRRNYLLLSAFDFLYLFSWAATMSFFVIWTTQNLGISATKIGIIYSVNALIALLMQPVFGYVSDKLGLRKRLIWFLVFLLLPIGPFFIYVYSPLLVNAFWIGALLGGLYLGIIFNSGCGVVDSYLDKVSRRYSFEYGRVRMWGSLGWAFATWLTGKYIDSDPNVPFWLASAAIVLAGLCFLFTKIDLTQEEVSQTESLKINNALQLLRNKQFWMLMIFMLFVNQIYDTYEQQFAQFFSMQFATRAEGNHWFGILGSIQVFFETVFLAIVPWFVNRVGAKKALVIAGIIMSARILGSAIELGPIWIASLKMAHAIEKPLIVVSLFKYIAANFDHKLSSTVYLLMLFSASLATTIYSPIAGYLYDTLGFINTYIIFGTIAGVFTLFTAIMLKDKSKQSTSKLEESTAV